MYYRPETGSCDSCVPPLTCAVLVSSPVFVAVDLRPGASWGWSQDTAPAASLVLGGNDQTGQGQTLQTSYTHLYTPPLSLHFNIHPIMQRNYISP